jgi:hypothetical protein
MPSGWRQAFRQNSEISLPFKTAASTRRSLFIFGLRNVPLSELHWSFAFSEQDTNTLFQGRQSNSRRHHRYTPQGHKGERFTGDLL